MAKPIIIYHRGRHGNLPDGRSIKENSLEAFDAAVAEQAQMIELDVWEGLKVSHERGDSGAPTLPQVLALVAGRSALNIEIKSPAALADVIVEVKKAIASGVWGADQFVVSSFHHQTALMSKKELPNVRAGAVNDGVLLPRYIEELRAGGIENLHLEWCNLLMDIENSSLMLKAAKNCGMHIWTWTVNSLDIFKTVAAYGAEGIFTDRPELFR